MYVSVCGMTGVGRRGLVMNSERGPDKVKKTLNEDTLSLSWGVFFWLNIPVYTAIIK